MKTDRRDVLALLGLAGAGVAVSTETFGSTRFPTGDGYPGLPGPGPEFQELAAQACEKLAAAIRSGTVAAMAVETKSKADFDNWLKHDVTFSIEILRSTGTS